MKMTEPTTAVHDEGGADATSGTRAGLRFALLLALLAAVTLSLWLTPLGAVISRERVVAFLAGVRRSPLAPLLFVGLYTAASAFALPGSALTLAGGALFGLWPGLLLNWVGATIGATLAFLLARLLGRDFVARRLGGRVAALDTALGRHGFRALLFFRLVPLVPFNALNYGAGLSSVRLTDYVLATMIGILPGTFAYTYFADSILAGSLAARRNAFFHVILAGALLLLLSLLPLLWRRYRRRQPG